jgi:hypothetical protein
VSMVLAERCEKMVTTSSPKKKDNTVRTVIPVWFINEATTPPLAFPYPIL